MIALGCTLIIAGATLVALASLMDSASRLPRLLRGLEAERQRLESATPYTGPTYTRHGRITNPKGTPK